MQVFPAAIYLFVTSGQPSLTNGWAIPAATDIAFAMGALALLGKHAPLSLKLLLVQFAIIDDMGAVAIIAIFDTSSINAAALAAAGGILVALFVLNKLRVMKLSPYLIGLALLWYATLLSGVHATIAGVVDAFLIPYVPSPGKPDAAESPLHRLEHALTPWVGFLIVPISGFVNAGLSFAGFSPSALFAPYLWVSQLAYCWKAVGCIRGCCPCCKNRTCR